MLARCCRTAKHKVHRHTCIHADNTLVEMPASRFGTRHSEKRGRHAEVESHGHVAEASITVSPTLPSEAPGPQKRHQMCVCARRFSRLLPCRGSRTYLNVSVNLPGSGSLHS